MSHPYNDHRKIVRDITRSMKGLAASADYTREQMEAFNSIFDARRELKERLNIRLQGGDPGEPFNWRGERGMW
jgi:hypothetical protein